MKKILSIILLLILITTTSLSWVNADYSSDTEQYIAKNYPTFKQKIDVLFIKVEEKLSNKDYNFKKQVYTRLLQNVWTYEKRKSSDKKVSTILSYIKIKAENKIAEIEVDNLANLDYIFEGIIDEDKKNTYFSIETINSDVKYDEGKNILLWEFKIDSSDTVILNELELILKSDIGGIISSKDITLKNKEWLLIVDWYINKNNDGEIKLSLYNSYNDSTDERVYLKPWFYYIEWKVSVKNNKQKWSIYTSLKLAWDSWYLIKETQKPDSNFNLNKILVNDIY